MNTAVTIVDTITRTVVELAFIGAVLKFLLTVAPGLRLTAAPKASQPKGDTASRPDENERLSVLGGPGKGEVAA